MKTLETKGGGKTARHSLPKLAVMACPQHAGKHPFHDQRWIVTEGTTIEYGHDPRPDQWHTVGGSLVAEMRDCDPGTAQAIVIACNSHESSQRRIAELEGALQEIERRCERGHAAHMEKRQNYSEHFGMARELARAVLLPKP